MLRKGDQLPRYAFLDRRHWICHFDSLKFHYPSIIKSEKCPLIFVAIEICENTPASINDAITPEKVKKPSTQIQRLRPRRARFKPVALPRMQRALPACQTPRWGTPSREREAINLPRSKRSGDQSQGRLKRTEAEHGAHSVADRLTYMHM